MSVDRPSFEAYLAHRLGSGSPSSVLGRMVARAFSMPTFRGFWQVWNPAYGYLLGYFCYAPLKRLMPHWLCVLVTFAASGFVLHDLPIWGIANLAAPRPLFPFVTVAFLQFGLLVVVSEACGLSLRSFSSRTRVIIHAATIAAAFLVAAAISTLVGA